MTLYVPNTIDDSFDSHLKQYVQEFLVHITSMSSMFRPEHYIDQTYIDSISNLKIHDLNDLNDQISLQFALSDRPQYVPITIDIIHSDDYSSDIVDGFLVTSKDYIVFANDYLIASAVASFFMMNIKSTLDSPIANQY